MKELTFKPLTRYMSAGNEIQVCTTKYKGIEITERSFFPYNPFKNPVFWYIVDLVLPIETTTKNGVISDEYYTAPGYGLPVFNTLDDATAFIANFRRTNLKLLSNEKRNN
jgi:hypothetical protein